MPHLLGSVEPRSGIWSAVINREDWAWLGIPVSDQMWGAVQVLLVEGHCWLVCTDGYRLHALRVNDESPTRTGLALPVTRISWEMKFGKEKVLHFRLDPEDVQTDPETGEVTVRWGITAEGKDSARDLGFDELPFEPLNLAPFFDAEIEWVMDRTEFAAPTLSDILRGVGGHVCLGRIKNMFAMVVAGSAKPLRDCDWFGVMVAKQPELPLGEAVVETSYGLSDEVYSQKELIAAIKFTCGREGVSTSALQRKFSIGFMKAKAMLERMEALGIVGPRVGPALNPVLMQEVEALETLAVVTAREKSQGVGS